MFSEKYGYKPEKMIQYECITENLRHRIWNIFYQQEIKEGEFSSKRIGQAMNREETIEEKIADRLGFLITRSLVGDRIEDRLRNSIIKIFKWYEVYDFVEIYISFLHDDEKEKRIGQYNDLFEQEKSGYRIVAGEIAPITNKNEIATIEQAVTTPLPSVNQHIQKALALYSDIENPDYENSVKESISAIEAICCSITGTAGTQATLGKTIKKLKGNGIHIHPAMESAFSSLYGYTSDENGIRHGGIDFVDVPAEDAKYMLIACSAFVNYLVEKWTKVAK